MPSCSPVGARQDVQEAHGQEGAGSGAEEEGAAHTSCLPHHSAPQRERHQPEEEGASSEEKQCDDLGVSQVHGVYRGASVVADTLNLMEATEGLEVRGEDVNHFCLGCRLSPG